MKRKWLIVAFTSLLIVAACGNDKEDKKIEEAQAILKEATQLLDEVKQKQKEEQKKNLSEFSSQDSYKEWVQLCVDKRNQAEKTCTRKETPNQQAGCLISASKTMGLCIAENNLTNMQDKVILETGELGKILGETALELEKWVKNNEVDLNSLAQNLTPFLEGLGDNMSTNIEGEKTQLLEEFLNRLGQSFSEGLEKGAE